MAARALDLQVFQTPEVYSLDPHLEREVAALPEKLRFPFVFCVLDEHSYEECAAVLKTNRKAVETRIYRARQRLRDRLARNPLH